MTHLITKWFSMIDNNSTGKERISHLFLIYSLSLLCLFSPNVLADGQKENCDQRLNLMELLNTVGQGTSKATNLVLASKAEETTLRFRWPSNAYQHFQIDPDEDIDATTSYILIHGVVDSQRIEVSSDNHKLFQKAISQLQKAGNCIQKGTNEDKTVFVVTNEQGKTVEVCITPKSNGGWVAGLRRPSKKNPKDKGIDKGKSKKDSIEEILGIPVLLDSKSDKVAKFLERRQWFPFSIHLYDYELYVNGKCAAFDFLSLASSMISGKKGTVACLRIKTEPKIDNELKAVYSEVLETVISKCIPDTVSQQRENGSKDSFSIHLKGAWLRSTQELDFVANLTWYQGSTGNYYYINVKPEMFGKRNHSQENNQAPARKTKENKESLHLTTQPSTLPTATKPSGNHEKNRQGWPAKGTTMCGGKSRLLNWLPTSVVEYQNAELQFSSDDGKTWATVATKLKPGQVVIWTVPKVTSKNCLLRISGLDAESKSIPLETSDSFGVGDTDPFDMDTEE